jgi:arsenite methyltransferase
VSASSKREAIMFEADRIRDEVRARYADAAQAASAGSGRSAAQESCCADGTTVFGGIHYDNEQRASLPDAAVLASLGCGNPTAVAELREGERVLDLGSGGGIDVLLSARRVGPTGRAFGVDMTDEMLELAQRNAQEAGATNVEFLKGTIEAIPLPAGSVDVVISNCVINLSTDKQRVFAEIARVLRAGGRMGVSDVVADDRLSPADRLERGTFAGCIAGALSVSEYREGLRAAGLEEIVVEPTHPVADGLYGAIIRAVKPAGWTPPEVPAPSTDLPVLATPGSVIAARPACGCGSGGCC